MKFVGIFEPGRDQILPSHRETLFCQKDTQNFENTNDLAEDMIFDRVMSDKHVNSYS